MSTVDIRWLGLVPIYVLNNIPRDFTCKKGKFSRTCYRAFGPELIPVHRWLFKSSLVVGCHYFPPGLRSPSQLKNVSFLWPIPNYTVWWRWHVGVTNLPKFVAQLCLGENWTPNLLITRPMPYYYVTVSLWCCKIGEHQCCCKSWEHLVCLFVLDRRNDEKWWNRAGRQSMGSTHT